MKKPTEINNRRTNPSLLRQLMRVRGLTSRKMGSLIGRTQPMVDRYLEFPGKLNSQMRAKLAKELDITIDQMDDICNGKKTRLVDLLNEIEPAENN